MKSQHNLKPHYIMHSQYVMLNIRWWLYYFISIKYIFHYLFLNILTISSLSKMNYINTTYLGTCLPTYILIFKIYIPGFSYINNIYRLIKRKVWGKKKCTRVCVYYKNYARFRQKSIKSAKSTHPENSKLVRQVHVVQKVPPGSMIEQKNGFCENTIFVKNYLQTFWELQISKATLYRPKNTPRKYDWAKKIFLWKYDFCKKLFA